MKEDTESKLMVSFASGEYKQFKQHYWQISECGYSHVQDTGKWTRDRMMVLTGERKKTKTKK